MNTQRDSARLWQSSLPGIELYQARLIHHRFGKHFHEAYTIGLNEAGLGSCEHRGERRFHSPGSFNLIHPGDMHTGQVDSAGIWAFRNLYISVPAMEQALTQLEYPTSRVPYFKDMIFWRPSLRPHFYRLFRALNAPTSPLAPRVMLLDLVSALFATQTGDLWKPRAPRPESKAVAHVRAYLEAHCTESTSLENLAGLVNLSPYYLIRCFRQQIGCSPHLYQRHWQLLQVKQRLQTAEPLAEIAINCGFYDQSHLNRAFKRTFGVTPGQYRQDNFVQDC